MKTIVFVRHAKSSWTDFRLSDFERPLDERGIKDAPKMALKLKSFVYPELIISSPANRALTTANVFAELFQCPVQKDRNLYHGFPENYLEAINEVPENVHCIALFGHNPGLTILANSIQSGCTDNLPTCGVVIVSLKQDPPWADITFDDMKIEQILYPKMENL